MLRAALVIARRELAEAVGAPRAYVLAATMLALAGLLFVLQVASFSAQSAAARVAAGDNPALLAALSLDVSVVAPYLQALTLLVLVSAPIQTMGALAGERRSGTLELLLSAPVPVGSIVVGKFLAAFATVLAPMLAALALPAALATVAPVDLGALAAGAVGLAALAAAATALGVLTSTLTRSEAVAAFACFALLVASGLAGLAGDALTTNVGTLLSATSVLRNVAPFLLGVIDTGAGASLLALAGLCLLFAHHALEARRWA